MPKVIIKNNFLIHEASIYESKYKDVWLSEIESAPKERKIKIYDIN